MMLPMIGFFMFLFVVGGLGSLVTMADPARAKGFPIMLATFFTGLSIFVWLLLAAALESIFQESLQGSAPAISDRVVSAFILLSLLICPVAGAVCGYKLGLRRNRRLQIQ